MYEAIEDLRRPGVWLVSLTAAHLVLLLARCSCGAPSAVDGGHESGMDAARDAGHDGGSKGDAGNPDKDSGPPETCAIAGGTWIVQTALVPTSTASNCVSQLPAQVESIGDLAELTLDAAPPCNPACACTMSGPNAACETSWMQACTSTTLNLHMRSSTRIEGIYRQTRVFTGLTCDWDVLITPL